MVVVVVIRLRWKTLKCGEDGGLICAVWWVSVVLLSFLEGLVFRIFFFFVCLLHGRLNDDDVECDADQGLKIIRLMSLKKWRTTRSRIDRRDFGATMVRWLPFFNFPQFRSSPTRLSSGEKESLGTLELDVGKYCIIQ